MLNYLKSILPRIQQHSKALDDVATFADKEWAFMDDDGHKVSYIFRRNNELLVTKHGEVITGKWEYLAFKQSLLIEHEGRKRMYNQGFINDTIMLLRKDGTDELFPLGNVQLLPGLEVERYIEEALIPQISLSPKPNSLNEGIEVTYDLKDGGKIKIVKQSMGHHKFYPGNEVYLMSNRFENSVNSDGTYHLSDGHELIVENGIIKEAYLWYKYLTQHKQELSIRLLYNGLEGSLNFRLGIIEPGLLIQAPPEISNTWVTLEDDEVKLLIQNNMIAKVSYKSDQVAASIAIILLIVFAILSIVIIGAS